MENTILENNSLKEYYVKILGMQNNATNMLTALNQALSTTSSEVTVTLADDSGAENTVKIPSFIYLENKLEQLENNFNNLFKMPESGEAWFSKESDMFKLELVKTSSTPVKPEVKQDTIFASVKDNNFLKDLVSPQAFLKMDISNLPDNIEEMFMRKIIFYSPETFNTIQSQTLTNYDSFKAALYNLIKGVDYDEYDSKIELPTRYDTFVSQFKIQEIPELDSGNPWYDYTSKSADGLSHLSYQLVLDTLEYTNEEDSSIAYTLKAGDMICLPNNLVVYKVKHVDTTSMTVIIEETIGHVALQPYEENVNMYFSIYTDTFSKFHYVEVPLEENQYIALFLGTIHNNTRSILSDVYMADLSTIKMYDKDGNKITDENGNHINYIQYYEEYCTNIGDLLNGLTKIIYPQLESFNYGILDGLQTSDAIKKLVSDSLEADSIEVLPINKHLIDNSLSENIINLNAQKAEIQSQLTTLQGNIDTVYNTLSTSSTPSDANSQLQAYYSQRTELQKQLNSVITNISIANNNVTISKTKTKYHVRGITKTGELDTYLLDYGNNKLCVIGMDVEYKYKPSTKDSSFVTSIGSVIFTDWVKQSNIDRERKLTFKSDSSSYKIDFVDYGDAQNIIKWNQIDIPIQQGETVIVRVRYKYNVGQPFINLYTPWSSERTFIFPEEYTNSTEVSEILANNEQDAISAKFTETLSNNGYEEHINNSITQNNVKYYHMPDNIYSGFTTAENNYISLNDKLHTMDNNINKVMELVNAEFNKKYSVSLVHDGTTTTLTNSTVNKVQIFNTDHISDAFVKNQMKIVIKNTGDAPVKLYSIFPGNVDIPLLLNADEFYEQYLVKYERVPLVVDNCTDVQTLGQWIYFRQDNPYTGEMIYKQSDVQDVKDFQLAESTARSTDDSLHVTFNSDNGYMKENNNQILLGYRRRTTGEIQSGSIGLQGLDFSKGDGTWVPMQNMQYNQAESLNSIYYNKHKNFFIYRNIGKEHNNEVTADTTNNCLIKFEDICCISNKTKVLYLDSETTMSEFIANADTVAGTDKITGIFLGAFLYPDIKGRSSILVGSNDVDYIEIGVGKSISVPITFEYFIDGENKKSITKSLYFDIRDSLSGSAKHYLLELSANYDYTTTGTVINQSSMVDELTAELSKTNS